MTDPCREAAAVEVVDLMVAEEVADLMEAEASTTAQAEEAMAAEANTVVVAHPHWTKRIYKLCTIDRNTDAAPRLLHHLSSLGYRSDSLNIRSIIHALCESNHFPEAHRRFLNFISSNCAPNKRTCSVLITRLLNGCDPFSTCRLINSLIGEKPKFVPSLVNYNRLVDGFCKLGRLDIARLMLYHMKERTLS
ncbi:pentatricopeptide repeat-containing protein at3g18020 [Phtheirospermum japonicum]|uniref:Pentatricopeptide repeat-containing protein at3g18020 n=1 Tax=Phtheirospermum japonicum TaxID=374723 RepID=A0A830CYK5_9LAMI|nr:pentatricopeptide repeat-containing protein at3g18020 [Phtheirospermum japonicum]